MNESFRKMTKKEKLDWIERALKPIDEELKELYNEPSFFGKLFLNQEKYLNKLVEALQKRSMIMGMLEALGVDSMNYSPPSGCDFDNMLRIKP